MLTACTVREIVTQVTIVVAIGLGVGCDDDRLRSEDVTFPDPALQACFEEILTTPSGKPYADEIELLRCTLSDIVSLEGIEVLSGLKEISLRENPRLATIEPVLSLSELTRLDLANCGLGPDSTVALSRLLTPIRLNISGNDLGDISAYAKTTSLIELIAERSNITTGVAELVTLTNATIVSLYGNPASPCADLEFLRTNSPEQTMIFPLESEVLPEIDCAP